MTCSTYTTITKWIVALKMLCSCYEAHLYVCQNISLSLLAQAVSCTTCQQHLHMVYRKNIIPRSFIISPNSLHQIETWENKLDGQRHPNWCFGDKCHKLDYHFIEDDADKALLFKISKNKNSAKQIPLLYKMRASDRMEICFMTIDKCMTMTFVIENCTLVHRYNCSILK